jgi:hypothetical protein
MAEPTGKDWGARMNSGLAWDLWLPLELPWPPAGAWYSLLIGGLWLLGVLLSAGGTVGFSQWAWRGIFASDLPDWIGISQLLAWLTVNFLAWWMTDHVWHAIAVNSAALGALLAFGAVVVNGVDDGFLVLAPLVLAGFVAWLTWPSPRDNITWISNAVFGGRSGQSAGIDRKPANMETARAELDRCLAWWKTHPGEPYLDRSQFQYMLGDMHMGTGFELKSYQIGPGREAGEGMFEFRVSMELTRFRLSTGNQALFPEKTYLVAKQPPMDTWMIQDQALADAANVEGLMQELLPDNPGY